MDKTYKLIELVGTSTDGYESAIQNAIEQARHFTEATSVTALALTKLDGTAKGGVVLGISDIFKIPIKYIGIGEKIDQLQIFNINAFVDSLFAE